MFSLNEKIFDEISFWIELIRNINFNYSCENNRIKILSSFSIWMNKDTLVDVLWIIILNV